MYDAVLSSTNFTNADLRNLTFNYVSAHLFTGVVFTGADLRSTSFDRANLASFDLSGHDLSNANFSYATLTSVDLRTTTLTAVTFYGANLTGANFAGVDLSTTNNEAFRGANLTRTNFTGAKFYRTDGHTTFVYDAVLSSTNFTNADARNLTLTNIASNTATDSNFSGATLSNANLSNVNFTASNFSDAVLNGISINSGTNFSGVTGLRASGTGIGGTTSNLPNVWQIVSGNLIVTKVPTHAPTITESSQGIYSATLTWTAPTQNTGDAITGYDVCADSVCVIVGSAVRTKTITGLTGRSSYTVSVAAHNAAGDSPSDSRTLTPITSPDAPTIGGTTPVYKALTVTWTAPAFDGGLPITGYRACIAASCVTTNAGARTATVTGLVGGDDYTMSVVAINDAGDSAATTVVATPRPFVAPIAPVITEVSRTGRTATLRWNAPTKLGGAQMLSYMVCVVSVGCIYTASSARSLTVTGVNASGDLSVALTATSGAGSSPVERAGIVNAHPVVPGADLAGVDLHGGRLNSFDLRGVDLTGADLSGATLRGATLTGARLTGADLSGAFLNGVTASGVDFSSANLTEAVLGEGTFAAANFTSAVMVGADARSASFAGANVTDADLTGVDLRGAVLSGTKFNRSDLTSALLHNVTINGLTDFRSLTGITAGGTGIVGTTALIPVTWSIQSGTLKVARPTSAPLLRSVTPRAGSVTVAWDAPLNDGGLAASSYIVCAGATCTEVASSVMSATISGLTNGVPYTVSVRSRNAAGDSVRATRDTISYAAPGAPTITNTKVSDGKVTVSWSAPTSDGGSPITGYTVCVSGTCRATSVGIRSLTTGNLVNGTSVTITIVASNAMGTSPAATTVATPVTKPSAPRITSLLGQNRAISVIWAPGDTGGSPITGYRVCATGGSSNCVDLAGTATSYVFASLVNGRNYTVRITATTAIGSASASSSATPQP